MGVAPLFFFFFGYLVIVVCAEASSSVHLMMFTQTCGPDWSVAIVTLTRHWTRRTVGGRASYVDTRHEIMVALLLVEVHTNTQSNDVTIFQCGPYTGGVGCIHSVVGS